MPCTKCNSDFNLFTWKLKCYECEEHFCTKCVKKTEGEFYCEICEILIKRPPIRSKLMELKSKDLQQYLNKRNISTYGIVEKQELVELFFRASIPVRCKKNQKRFSNAFSGSVPNLAAKSQSYLISLRNNAEAAFSRGFIGGQSANNSPQRSPAESPTQPNTSSNFGQNSSFSPTATSSSQNVIDLNNVKPEESPQVPRKFIKLSDFESADDLNELSVKQLKELLALNRVDYKGCVEKNELLERANRLWNDTRLRKDDVVNASGEENVEDCCKICMDAPLDCVLLECGHIATCIDCGKQLAECPICRQYVTRVVRTFKA